MRILIVDDSLSARFFLKNCIPEDREYEIAEAADGKEGHKKFIEFNPDVTFLDITMPVMDGFEALKAIREYNPQAIVAVLTSDVQKKTTERIMALGAFQFLKKPPQKEIILEILNTVSAKIQSGK